MKTPNRPKLEAVLRQIAIDLDLSPSDAVSVHIEHEHWCREVDGTGECSCVPVVTVTCDKGEFAYHLTPAE